MMKTREEYLELISARGDRYGGSGGLYDLLEWSVRNGPIATCPCVSFRFSVLIIPDFASRFLLPVFTASRGKAPAGAPDAPSSGS